MTSARSSTSGRRSATGWDACFFQCPPSLQYRRDLIEAFVGYLPPPGPGVPRFAMEFRHPSWTEARELLLSQGIAWCVAETDEQDPGPDDLSWEPAGLPPACARPSTPTRSSPHGR